MEWELGVRNVECRMLLPVAGRSRGRNGKHEVQIYLPFDFAGRILATTIDKISLVSERDFSSMSFMDSSWIGSMRMSIQ